MSIYTNAIRKASEIRLKLGVSIIQPINIYDVCKSLEVDVQFVDINMEGLYINNSGNPKILISNLRPFPRRVFTCGHELGHHLFNHGFKLDIITDEHDLSDSKSHDEILVDAFSASLLMPIAALYTEFSLRKLNYATATPIDYYIISSIFNVGYQTLITHCKINGLIKEYKYFELLKFSPRKIFKQEFGDLGEAVFFKIIDGKSILAPIDLEVSNYISIPSDFLVESDYLLKIHETENNILYQTIKSGISSIHSNLRDMNYFIRIQPEKYIGFTDYRHLEK